METRGTAERTYILLCFDSVLTPVIFFVQSSYYICNSLLVTTIKIEHFEMIADDRRIGADSIRVPIESRTAAN